MKFYRYEDVKISNLGVQIQLREFKLHKETPKGYWISYNWSNDKDKWVSKNGKNRFAYPTKEEALHNFRCRKERQVSILTARLNDAIWARSLAEKESENVT